MMERDLGGQGLRGSAVALGCMGMSHTYGHRDEAESIATIQRAIELGVTLLDTGDFYGCGHNELLIREAIKGRRDRVALSVKFGALRNHDGAFIGHEARPASIRNYLCYSLVRLGVDEIDFYFPARVDHEVPIEETVGTLGELVKEGKVRYVGLSEASAVTIERAHREFPISAVETEVSLFSRDYEADVLPVTRELGIGILSYGAFSRGLYGAGIQAGHQFQPGEDIRHRMPRFQGENLARNLEMAEGLEKIAAAKGCTVAQLCVAWVLAQGENMVSVVGTTRRDHLEENLAAADVALTPHDLAELDRLFPPGAVAGERYPPAILATVNR